MRLKMLFILAVINTALAGLAFAQTNSDYKKVEVFAGFTTIFAGDKTNSSDTILITPVNRPLKERVASGYTGSAVFNVHRFLGIKSDFAYVSCWRDIKDVSIIAGNSKQSMKFNRSTFTMMGGIQIKDNSSSKRLKPFGHILAGVGRVRAKAENIVSCNSSAQCTSVPDINKNSDFRPTVAVGGGLDVKLNETIAIRAFQFDYNPIFLKAGTAHNIRVSTGVVFHF